MYSGIYSGYSAGSRIARMESRYSGMRIVPKQTLTCIIPIILIPDWSQTSAPLGYLTYHSGFKIVSTKLLNLVFAVHHNQTNLDSVIKFIIACEQALHLGLMQYLFWKRFIWVSREIWARAARGLGRGRGKESLPPWLKNFHFYFAWVKRNPIGWKWHASINFCGKCRNVLNRVPGGENMWK